MFVRLSSFGDGRTSSWMAHAPVFENTSMDFVHHNQVCKAFYGLTSPTFSTHLLCLPPYPLCSSHHRPLSGSETQSFQCISLCCCTPSRTHVHPLVLDNPHHHPSFNLGVLFSRKFPPPAVPRPVRPVLSSLCP